MRQKKSQSRRIKFSTANTGGRLHDVCSSISSGHNVQSLAKLKRLARNLKLERMRSIIQLWKNGRRSDNVYSAAAELYEAALGVLNCKSGWEYRKESVFLFGKWPIRR